MGNNDTFHICKCLGKSFTYDEYTDFVKGDSSSHTVFEHDGFKFNAWDVCLNPNMALEWQGKSCKFKVETAKSPNGRWDYGTDCWFVNGGVCHAACFVDGQDGFPTEKECVYAALKYFEENVHRKISEGKNRVELDDNGEPIKGSSTISHLRECLNQIRKFKEQYNPKQLSLFDF